MNTYNVNGKARKKANRCRFEEKGTSLDENTFIGTFTPHGMRCCIQVGTVQTYSLSLLSQQMSV